MLAYIKTVYMTEGKGSQAIIRGPSLVARDLWIGEWVDR